MTFATGFLAVEHCLYGIRVEQQNQVEQNLQDVAQQNCEQVQIAINLRMKFLEAMSSQMSDEAYCYYLVDQFAPLLNIYDANLIGYASPKGLSYTTDKLWGDVSGMEFFQAGMQGNSYVSSVIFDGGSQEETFYIHSVPVYSVDGKNVTGVMFVAYSVDVFNDILRVDSFAGLGSSCIIQADGQIIAVSDARMENTDNIFSKLIQAEPENEAVVADLTRCLEEEGHALSTLSDGEKGIFFCVERVEDKPGNDPWYLATIVPTSVLSERVQPMLENVRNMLICVVALLISCVLIYLWTSHQQRKDLYQVAYVDPLTHTHNYAAFREKMRRCDGVSGAGYVISLDLHGFGTINNSHGVAKGDEVIRAMSQILVDNVGQGELMAHVTGDRFVLFLHSPSQDALVERITSLRHQIIDLAPLLEVPHVVPKFGIRPVDTPKFPERGYGDANLAKNDLRGRPGHFYAFFNEQTHNQALEVQALEDSFLPALEGHEFEMWYQPKYSPITGKLVAAEALVRWRKPDGTMVPPGKFIPLFERNGMITQLDEYTMDCVCAQQRAWLDEGLDVVPISINVSRVSLYYPDLVARYMVIMNRHGVTTENIELEITEGAVESNKDLENMIRQFRACGFRILMDDFGSGYSSLSTLAKRYFDNIKIDKSLVDCIGAPEGDALLKSIVHLAHELNMTVTAEGVEQVSQVNFLIILACDNIQGYYYSQPLPVSDFRALLSKRDG